MFTKRFLQIVIVLSIVISCTSDNDITVPRNLEEYLEVNTLNTNTDVIACAGNADENTDLVYIYYFPPKEAEDVRYYEADSLNVDITDLSKFRRRNLSSESVFGGKLKRFSRTGEAESWCLVTYLLNDQLVTSNPIRLKNKTNPTQWTKETAINYKTVTEPNFNWKDLKIDDSVIYFQAFTEIEENSFISGTYTEETFYQYNDTSNVILDINEGTVPESLEEEKEYLFTMLGVSEDNWINIVDERNFIPGNLQRYLNENASKEKKEAFAFGASANVENPELTYLYYLPLAGASDLRYYETDAINVDENNFENYRRQNLTDEAVFGGRFRRYLRAGSKRESWSIVTYVIEGVLYQSKPVKIKIESKPTEWILRDDGVAISYPQTLRPVFTWADGKINENSQYLKVLSDQSNTFITGVFTEQKSFTYYNEATITSKIHTVKPPALIFDDQYKIFIAGLSTDNWANLLIERTFKAQ